MSLAGRPIVEQRDEPETMRFDSAVTHVLGEALNTAAGRGSEYQDSWGDEHFKTPFRDALSRWEQNWILSKLELDRLYTLAAACDLKMSRLIGPFKADTFIDLINYAAVLCYEIQKVIGDL